MPAKLTKQPLDRLRAIIAEWPETSERLSHGAPTFWGGKKTFASFTVNHHGDGRVAIWCKSTFDAQQSLVEADPDVFFVPPYVGPSGWLGIRVDRPVSWTMVEALLLEGYRMVAPARALKQLAAGPSDPPPPPRPKTKRPRSPARRDRAR